LKARRPVLITALLMLTAFAWTGSAVAASPQKIYKDLADNGRLDAKYSRTDLARALNLQQAVKTDQTLAPVRRPSASTPVAAAAKGPERRVPFTGLDVALLLVGGGPLLLIGVGLRRRLALAEPAEIVGS
jgi:hypothetical protein